MAKTFCIGDVHGGYKALMQCLKRSKFRYRTDKLICLGDICDGWPETSLCIEELLKIKNLVYTTGNHDIWLHNFFQSGLTPDIWTMQGGRATMKSYLEHMDLLLKHRGFFVDKKPYHVEDNKLFIHGGYVHGVPIEEQSEEFLTWDRNLWINRHNLDIKDFDEVYCGHTSIWRFSHKPIKYNRVWFMDTGGGYEGKLSMIDVNSKEIFQSDIVNSLYIGFSHR